MTAAGSPHRGSDGGARTLVDFIPQQRASGKRAKTAPEPPNIRVLLRTKVRAPPNFRLHSPVMVRPFFGLQPGGKERTFHHVERGEKTVKTRWFQWPCGWWSRA